MELRDNDGSCTSYRLEGGALILIAGSFLVEAMKKRRPPAGVCAKCSYDLTGNMSGVCPECGTAAEPYVPGGPEGMRRTIHPLQKSNADSK